MTPKEFERSRNPEHWVEPPSQGKRCASTSRKIVLRVSPPRKRLPWALRFRGIQAGLLLFSCLLGCAGKPATDKAAFVEPMAPSVIQARDVVKRLHDETIAIARLGSELSFEERRERLMKLDLESFNFSRMAQLSYGKGFVQLTPEQKRIWVNTFTLLRCSGSARVNARYRGQEYRFIGYDRVSDDVVLIRSGVRYPKRAVEIAIDYRLLREEGRWRIVDRYTPPSVSEVVMRRAEYRPILQEEGFDGLILDMERRIQGYSSR